MDLTVNMKSWSVIPKHLPDMVIAATRQHSWDQYAYIQKENVDAWEKYKGPSATPVRLPREPPPAVRQVVRDLVQERLDRRLPPPQAEEADGPVRQAHVRPYEPVGPVRADVEGVAQERYPALRVRAAQEDDHPGGRGLQVRLPPRREGASRRSGSPSWKSPS